MTLTGWGRIAPSPAELAEPSSLADAEALLKTATPARHLIARGLGRSYNNAAQCGGGVVVSTARLDRIIDLDPVTGLTTCEAGVSLEQLMVAGLPAAGSSRCHPAPVRSPSAARSRRTCTARTITWRAASPVTCGPSTWCCPAASCAR